MHMHDPTQRPQNMPAHSRKNTQRHKGQSVCRYTHIKARASVEFAYHSAVRTVIYDEIQSILPPPLDMVVVVPKFFQKAIAACVKSSKVCAFPEHRLYTSPATPLSANNR